MTLADHYSTPPHEQHTQSVTERESKVRRLSLDPNQRTLFPLPSSRRPSLLEQAHTPTPSGSRRGSTIDGSLFASADRPFRSPPPSPAHHPTSQTSLGQPPLDPWSERLLPNLGTASPWRRDSLPPIAHLTGEHHGRGASALASPQSRHLMDDNAVRRHSIASTDRSTVSSSSHTNGDGLRLARRASSQSGPYSRTPELRVSHKLAERKRRKEMKDLFDDLRTVLPFDQGVKTSKWEILSKAVDYINHLQGREEQFALEKEQLLKELASIRAGK